LQDRRNTQSGARRFPLSERPDRNRTYRRGGRARKDRPDPDARGSFGAGPGGANLSRFLCRKTAANVCGPPVAETKTYGCNDQGHGWAGGLRNRRRDGSRHVLYGRDLFRFQSLAEGVGAPGRPESRGPGEVRGGPRRGSVSVRRESYKGTREKYGNVTRRRLQRVD